MSKYLDTIVGLLDRQTNSEMQDADGGIETTDTWCLKTEVDSMLTAYHGGILFAISPCGVLLDYQRFSVDEELQLILSRKPQPTGTARSVPLCRNNVV